MNQSDRRPNESAIDFVKRINGHLPSSDYNPDLKFITGKEIGYMIFLLIVILVMYQLIGEKFTYNFVLLIFIGSLFLQIEKIEKLFN